MKKLGLINMDNIKLAIPEKEWWEDGYEWDDETDESLDENNEEGEN